MGERKRATIVEVDRSGLTWRKSSASGPPNSNCVEFAQSGPAVYIRSSRDRHGAQIFVVESAWRLFVRTAPLL